MSAPFTVISGPLPAPRAISQRDTLWEHCRNALGIARLLVHEGRPGPLVDTACQMAVEAACRTALEQAALRYDGDVERGFARLAAPRDLFGLPADGRPAERLASAERVVAWAAAYLKSEAPERCWGY